MSPVYFPLKLNICKLVVDFQRSFNLYIPGLVLHIYQIFNSQLLQKRSKSQRITNVDIYGKISVSKEEETSDAYKHFIIDFCFDILKKHFLFLSTKNLTYVEPIKVYLGILSKAITNTYFIQRLNHFLKGV